MKKQNSKTKAQIKNQFCFSIFFHISLEIRIFGIHAFVFSGKLIFHASKRYRFYIVFHKLAFFSKMGKR